MAGEIADQLNAQACNSSSRMLVSNEGIEAGSAKMPPLT